MYVESFDRFSEVGEFDPESGTLDTYDRESAPTGERLVQGHYTTLAGTRVVFYRHAGDLWLRIGDRVWKLAGDTSVAWSNADGISLLVVTESGRQLANLEYESEGKDEDDLTAFGSDEDWDIGLFLSNVLHDQGRRQRIYTESAASD